MKQNEAERLADNLTRKFGLPVKATVTSVAEAQYVLIEPVGLHPNEAFKVRISVGWRSIQLEFLPGKFAAEIIYQMGAAPQEKKQIFVSISSEIIKERGILNFKVNESLHDPLDISDWPVNWRSFSMTLKRSPLEINTEDHTLAEKIINLWAERFFGCIIALSPLEEVDEGQEPTSGLPEGSVIRVSVNRYERSRYNRALCINFHGTDCKICGLNFEKQYGTVGTGFIHVHHVVPVSRLSAGYIINPIKDLVPVCPNCHAMLHRNDPPLTVEALKAMLNFTK